MSESTGSFVSQSATRSSKNFGIMCGAIDVVSMPAIKYFGGKMLVVSFAWLDSKNAPRHRPIIHSWN